MSQKHILMLMGKILRKFRKGTYKNVKMIENKTKLLNSNSVVVTKIEARCSGVTLYTE